AIGLTREDRPESRDVEAAGETLLARDEGFVAARAFQEAARIRAETGFRVGELRRRAARIYRDLQADRALATLLRTTNWPRDLAEFRVPASQFKQRSAGLTAREAEVAELASRGYTTREIAGMLSISPATSETHIRNLKRKLGISRKSELVRLREVNE
ncbi:MAG TPA: LuxR C-terminal-related transcriptional regulator, partial [Actinomycetota bacterium]|nr:LuxR C-terminal-related transcriptional regulator [Actinomycetota bacterium]